MRRPSASCLPRRRSRCGGGGGGAWAARRPGPPPPQSVELWQWRLQPGDSYASEAHLAGTRELLHVLAGRLPLTVEDETHLIGPADTVLFSADREHRYANKG